MTLRRLVVAITFLSVFAMATRVSVDTDTWWHLRAGQWIWEHKSIPLGDPFSYTRLGEEWRYPGWLVEVPLYAIYRWLGAGGLNLWVAGMVTLAFLFVWRVLSGGVFLRAFSIVLAVAAAGVYWAARPYMVTLLLTAIFFWILEAYRWGRSDRLWWLPLLMVIWVNSHGGFVAGFLLLGSYIVGLAGRPWRPGWMYRVRRLLWVGLAVVLAACLNPAGPEMLLYPFKTVAIGSLRGLIAEWQSPNFHQIQVQPFLWLLLLVFGAVGVSRKRLALVDFLLVSGFAYLGFLAGRNISLFALVAPAVLTRHAAPVLDEWVERLGYGQPARISGEISRRHQWVNLTLLLVLTLVVGMKSAVVFSPRTNADHFKKVLPVDAVNFIRQKQPPGRLFNHYNWGGYLLWALPEYSVFVDGRTDLYGDEVIGEWLQVVRAEAGWEGVLDRWGVRLILGNPDWPVVRLLENEGWQLLYRDELSVVYGR
jgi:hypothetical protein